MDWFLYHKGRRHERVNRCLLYAVCNIFSMGRNTVNIVNWYISILVCDVD